VLRRLDEALVARGPGHSMGGGCLKGIDRGCCRHRKQEPPRHNGSNYSETGAQHVVEKICLSTVVRKNEQLWSCLNTSDNWEKDPMIEKRSVMR
jgi:hypothetical protein